jgi:parallel beta-helix repeat protein
MKFTTKIVTVLSTLRLATVITFVAATFAVAQPFEVWVDDDYCNGCSNDGHTWDYDAFDNIQDGIDAVASPGTVNVAAGIYEGKVVLNSGISLLGAGMEISIIDGMDLMEDVVTMYSNTKISGFSIINGLTGVLSRYSGQAIIERNWIANHKDLAIGLLGYHNENTVVANNIVTDCGSYWGVIFGNTVGGSPQIINNTVVSNQGGGIGFWYSGTPIIKNNIIVNNKVYGIGVGGNPTYGLAEPINSHNNVWNNTAANWYHWEPGEGAISENPLFVNESGGDYHLQKGSPCIDAGTSENVRSTDIDGELRPKGFGYDMGADEFGFADVPPGYWAEDAIYKIYNAGITKGCSQDPLMYCPTKTVYRDQMAVFLGRATHDSNFTPPDATGIFADVPTWYWAANWIEQFYADGLTNGCKVDPHGLQSPTIYYCPKYPVTRTTMAIFLLRAKHGGNYKPPPATGIFGDVGVNYWAAAWIEQLYKEGITKGCKQNPLMYCPSNHVTRAQMAVFLTRMLGHYPAPVPKTGQKLCWDGNGNSIDCEGTGQDGELQMGVQWPDPRFTDNGDGTVTDKLTGLIWLKNANCFGRKKWNDALNDSNNLADGQCGLNDGSSPGDWRLPNVRELYSLTDFGNEQSGLPSGHPFTGILMSYYWSSTTPASYDDGVLKMGLPGGLYTTAKLWNENYVWLVRSSSTLVPKTGQTESYAPGDDGALQKGVPWADPRFTDNDDGTVTDHLTGLIWLKNANCFGELNWNDALNDSNNLADGQCGLNDGSSPGDWRLPNVRELHSLIDFGNEPIALPDGNPFSGQQPSAYWTSTTHVKTGGWVIRAWVVLMRDGSVSDHGKWEPDFVWPVRGGN